MKKTLFLIMYFSLINGLVLMDGCIEKKTPIKGCMDIDGINYNVLAEEEDGSCLYEAEIVFWYNQAVVNELIAEHVGYLKYTVNGIWNTSSVPVSSVYWTSAPDCFANDSYSTSIDLDHGKTQSLSLKVTDNTGYEYWNSTLNLVGNTCLKVELTLNSMKKKDNF